jgi:SpoVK/Ycf46/Vps4 family AAA+-type ATPase
VTDPETFFGSSPKYMLDVLLDEEDDEDEWRLLVLEDTGELLAADAKERTGQGLSRLLNVVDGLIGQGLRVVVLVTTNEPLGALHEAVSRPGRCAAQIEFAPFTLDEAREWLERNGGDAEPRAGTLASLYARAAGLEVRERRPVGFAR